MPPTRMTYPKGKELHVSIKDQSDNYHRAIFSKFSVGLESDGYRVNMSNYSTESEDSLAKQMFDWGIIKGERFATTDKHNGYNCIKGNQSGGHGWWSRACQVVNPTEIWSHSGIIWRSRGLQPQLFSFNYIEMMIKH